VSKHAGAFKSEKRKKELLRQKKQEEKRQKRLIKDTDMNHSSEIPGQEEQIKKE
jgi:hypothetical protein